MIGVDVSRDLSQQYTDSRNKKHLVDTTLIGSSQFQMPGVIAFVGASPTGSLPQGAFFTRRRVFMLENPKQEICSEEAAAATKDILLEYTKLHGPPGNKISI